MQILQQQKAILHSFTFWLGFDSNQNMSCSIKAQFESDFDLFESSSICIR